LSKPNTLKDTQYTEDDRLRVVSSCMQGWRTSMEDAHTSLLALPKFPHLSYFAVFDGHGGEMVGKFAATHVHMKLEEALLAQGEHVNIEEALKEAFLSTDRLIIDSSDVVMRTDTSGATAVAVVVDHQDRKVYCANAGDSRAVLCRSREAVALSEDHKPDNKIELDRIVKAGGFVANSRVNGSLALSRALGDREFKQNADIDEKEQAVTAFPDVRCETMAAQDEFFVIACDGIWDMLDNQACCTKILEFLETREAADEGLQFAAEELLDACLAKNPGGLGCDNMSAIIVQFRAPA